MSPEKNSAKSKQMSALGESFSLETNKLDNSPKLPEFATVATTIGESEINLQETESELWTCAVHCGSDSGAHFKCLLQSLLGCIWPSC